MTTSKNTKHALLMSVIALILCCSMLVGTTFAWFTDSVVSGNNAIVAGNLDVELFYSKTKDFSAQDKVDGQTVLFTDKDGNEIKHWEPGVIAYSNFQVANVGSLALTYRLHLTFNNMNTVTHEGVQYDLSDVLKVAIVEGGFEGVRTDAQDLDFDYALDSFYLEGELEGNTTTKTFGVVISWEPNDNAFDNIFNMNNGKLTDDQQTELRVDLGVNLYATQEEYEQDSFDDLYDEEAGKEIMAGEEITISGNDILESLENRGTVNVVGGVTNVDGFALENFGEANLKDVEVNAGNAGNYALITSGSNAETNLDNVDLNAAGGGIAAVDGATVNFNSGSVDLNSTSTSGRYLFYTVGEGSKIVINEGNFDFNKTQNQKRAYVYCGTGATVIINGGTFGKASTRSGYTAGILGDGTVIIYGGTFGFNPSAWVAEGYKAVQNGSVWSVMPAAADTVTGAIENGGTVNIGDNVTGVDATVAEGTSTTVELNGNTLEGTIVNDGTLVINGGTLTSVGEATLTNNGDATYINVNIEMTENPGYITNSRNASSVTVFENVHATSTGGGINVWNGEAVFKSGSVILNSTSTSARHVFYIAQGGELTIEDGEFTFNPTNLTRKGSYLCADGEGALITVLGGTFNKPSTRTAPIQAVNGGQVVIKGGTFAFDPSEFVAEGYEAVEADGWWTVSAK